MTTFSSVYLAEETLALPEAQRWVLVKILLESLKADGPSDQALRQMLDQRFSDLKTGKDQGMTFEQVFGESFV